MPISTGTNNVFPMMIEATIAGLAAGLVACGKAEAAVAHAPRIDIYLAHPSAARTRGSEDDRPLPDDIALVDAAVYDERFVAARAIWDGTKIKEIVLCRAEPGTIGLSSIGAHLLAGAYQPGHGVYLRLGTAGQAVQAPIAPGLLQTVYVTEHRLLAPGDEVLICHEHPCVLAVDGEREIELRAGTETRLRLNPMGPRVVDPRTAIALAARMGVFHGQLRPETTDGG